MCIRDRIWCNQKDYGEKIGNACICTGFQCIVPPFTSRRQEFTGRHGESCGDSDDQSGESSKASVLQGEGKSGKRTGQFYQCIIQAEYHKMCIRDSSECWMEADNNRVSIPDP